MLRLYVKDNTNGEVHEYGTNQHDSLIVQEDGSLHYLNFQSCTGTCHPEEGYSFCLKNGQLPPWGAVEDMENYIDIAGEYTAAPRTWGDLIRSMSDEQLAELLQAIIHERDLLIIEKLQKQGVEASLIERPALDFQKHLEWLRKHVNFGNTAGG